MLHIEWRRWSRGGQVRGAGKEVFASAPEGSRKALPSLREAYISFFFSHFLCILLSVFSYREMHKWGRGFALSRKTHFSLVELVRDRVDAYGDRKHNYRPSAKKGNRRPAFKNSNSHPTLRGGRFICPVLYRVFQRCYSLALSRRRSYSFA